ncbi:MAG: membrane protein insertase YidC [Alphaproteobacteria bacterium]|nr:membrane protein insertase YidC [Alphaproteobacteria bacterium]
MSAADQGSGGGGLDRNTLLAIVLALGVWYGWLLLFPPQPSEADEAEPGPVATDPVDGQAPAAPAGGAPATQVPAQPARVVHGELCRAEFDLRSSDGSVSDVVLLDHEAAYAVMPLWKWALAGFPLPYLPWGEPPGPEVLLSDAALALVAGAGAPDAAPPRSELLEEGPQRFVVRGVTPEGVQIVRTLAPSSAEPCVWTLEVRWTNTGDAATTGPLWVAVHDLLPESTGRYEAAMRPRAYVDGGLDYRDDLTALVGFEPLEGPVSWLGLADTYFAFLLVPEAAEGGRGAFSARKGPTGAALHGVHYLAKDGLAAGQSHTSVLRVYVGPKATSTLLAVAPDLGEAVELGWLALLAGPMLWLLRLFHGVVGNWGLAIVSLTVLVKALTFPLTQSSFKSSQAMQALQPKLQELNERFKDDPQKKGEATMKLFTEHGVNPLGGCLPMLLQMPVWIALYSALLAAPELYHTEFLYLRDLSRPDPWLFLPTVVVGLMVLQQQFVPTANMDPAQARMMKLMPLFFGIFFYTFPSGLVVYIFVNMVLSIAQQWYIRRTFSTTGPGGGPDDGPDPVPGAAGRVAGELLDDD